MADLPQDFPPDAKLGGLDGEALFAVGLGERGASGPTRGIWQPPSVEELQAGFPQYEIVSMLGHGGMGAVYKGWQKSLDRFVAIKILPPGLDDGLSDFTERFQREAKVLAQLRHPGIVAVHDAGQTPGGLLYFVMEYIEGTDVQQLVSERGRIAPGEALRITSAVCDALGYAHQRGLIHRDIKPSNVLLEADGRVKVADFGLAKSIAPGTAMLTVSHVAIGTPDFIAPETRTGAAAVDQRADVYAVGVMLYAMLTGEIPRGRFALPSTRVAGLDPRFDAIVDRAMQADPDQRYASALEMRADLEKVVPGFSPSGAANTTRSDSTQPRGLKPRTTLLAAAAALVLLAGGWVVWKSGHASVPPPLATQTPPIPSLEPGAIQLWESAGRLPGIPGIRWEDNAVRLDEKPLRYTGAPSRDAILRADVRMNRDSHAPQLNIRCQANHPGGDYLSAELGAEKSVVKFISIHSGKRTELKSWPLPRVYGPDEWVRLELRAIGDDLTVSADGQTLGTVHDTSHPEAGDIQLFALAAGFFRKIAYVPLDKPAPAAAPTSPPKKVSPSYPQPAQWIDATNEVGRKLVSAKVAVLEGDALRIIKSPCALPIADGREFHNGVVRMICSQRAFLSLRKAGTAYYSAHVGTNGSGSVEFKDTAQNATGNLKSENGIPRADFDLNTEHELVFAAQDDGLTLWIDGVEKATLRDGTLPRGKIGFQLNAADADGGKVRIRKIEYAELPEVAQTTTTPATATKDAPFVNGLGMKFVPVPITGGPTDGQRVLFSVWETRVQDYEVFLQQTKREWTKPAFLRDASHPAINVTWEDAQAFCVWLTGREEKAGRLGASERYRLPSDHEWSCAVGIGEREDPAKIPAERRGNMADVFPWGTAWPPPPGAGNYSGEEVAGHEWTKVQGVMVGYRDDFAQTAPVGSFMANGLGLFDLSGNAWEWCEDWQDREQQRRVLRGGSFASVARVGLLSSARGGGDLPTARVHYNGFRCVVSGDAAKAGAVPDAPAAGNKAP